VQFVDPVKEFVAGRHVILGELPGEEVFFVAGPAFGTGQGVSQRVEEHAKAQFLAEGRCCGVTHSHEVQDLPEARAPEFRVQSKFH
jgi:hypothetical protein